MIAYICFAGRTLCPGMAGNYVLAGRAGRLYAVGDVLGQRIRQFITLPEAFQKFVHRGFSVTGCLCDLTAAHAARVVQCQNSFVVHVRTSSDLDSSYVEEVVPL